MPTRPIAVAPAAVGDAFTQLPIARVQQAESEWCWAACGEMIGKYAGHSDLTQCKLANAYLQGTGFCVDACSQSSKCDAPCQLDRIARIYARFQIASTLMTGPVSPSTLAREIGSTRRPVMAMLTYHNGAGHVLLVTGYSGQGAAVYVMDTRPGYGEGWIDYNALVQAHGAGAWTASWVNIG